MKYTSAQYAKALCDLIEEKPSMIRETVHAFVKKLSANGQLGLRRDIERSIVTEWNTRKGIVMGEITVAEKDSVDIAAVAGELGHHIQLVKKTDSGIGAGVRIQIGDWRIDNTLARRFSKLKSTLTQ